LNRPRKHENTRRALALYCLTSSLVCLAACKALTGTYTISVAPKPNQTIRYTVKQEWTIEGKSGDGTPENQPPRSGGTLTSKMRSTFKILTNVQEQDGRIAGTLTQESQAVEMSFDGAFPAKEGSADVNRTFTIVYGADGDVIGLTEPGIHESTIDTTKRMIAETYKYFPTVTLSVGETVMQPLARAMPALLLPAGSPNVDPVGWMRMKLVSVEVDGNDRIAHCEQSYALKATWSATEITVSGTRKVQINLDRGIVKASQMETTYDSISIPVNSSMPTFKQHGVLRATVTGNN
jgi:hypothetical protein